MSEFEKIIAANWTQREADDATIREFDAAVSDLWPFVWTDVVAALYSGHSK